MLILSREKGEKVDVVIGGKKVATIVVTDFRGEKIRLGFEADREVVFVRSEIRKEAS